MKSLCLEREKTKRHFFILFVYEKIYGRSLIREQSDKFNKALPMQICTRTYQMVILYIHVYPKAKKVNSKKRASAYIFQIYFSRNLGDVRVPFRIRWKNENNNNDDEKSATVSFQFSALYLWEKKMCATGT